MSSSKPSAKRKRVAAGPIAKPDAKLRSTPADDDFDPDLSNDFKGVMAAFLQIKEKAQQHGQKKKEETLSSVAAEIKTKIEELKSKIDKDRQALAKSLSKSSKECENCLKNETEKFNKLYETFCKERDAHLQKLQDAMSKLEEEKHKFYTRYEQMRKKEKNAISELEKSCTEKISHLEEAFKKRKQEEMKFDMLRKTLGSFLDTASDEDFPPDD